MISIVVTAYNVEQYIGKCLKSILTQTYKDFELIIVEDASTDNTLEEILKFEDKRIKLIRHEENKGAGQSRKDGIHLSTGEYIGLIDADDYIDETFIEDLVARAEETDADIVSTGMQIEYPDGSYNVKTFGERISEGMQKFKDYNNGTIIFLANKLVRRKLYDIVPYSTKRYCEDTPVIIPLLYYANKVAYVNKPGYHYVQRDTSLCHSINLNAQDICKACCAKDLIKFFEDKEDDYRGIVSQEQFAMYIKQIKTRGIQEHDFDGFEQEYIEAMNYLINLINL